MSATTPVIAVRYGAATDAGLRRSLNEDAFLAEPPLFLIADGMGGHDAGEVASAAVIASFAHLAGRSSIEVAEVRRAYELATARVTALPEGGGAAAGTTLSGVAIAEHDGAAYWLTVNVGDSRTYRLAHGELEQISVDHSLVQELVEEGELTADQAAADPRRNVITKAIGAGADSVPDYWLIPAERGDRILVCSDGLSGEVDTDAIACALREELDPQAAATRLVHEALLRGGRDNVTVIVVDAVEVAGGDDGRTIPRGGVGVGVADAGAGAVPMPADPPTGEPVSAERVDDDTVPRARRPIAAEGARG